MKVLIVGAGGTLGPPLARRLVAEGHDVFGIPRSQQSSGKVEAAGARALMADALNREELARRVHDTDADVVVDLLTAFPRHGPTRASHLKATNRLRTEATANVIAAARATGVRRLIAESVVFAYGFGDLGERTLDETSTPSAHAPSSGMKIAQEAVLSLERQVFDMGAAEGIEGLVLRFGTLYGADVPTSEFMLKMLRRRMLALPGGGHSILPWIMLPDAVGAIVHSIQSPSADGIYNVVDDEPVRVSEFANGLAEVFGTPKPYRAPYWLGKSLMPFSAYLLDRTRLRASNAKAKTQLAWLPQYPTYRAGLRDWAESTTRGKDPPASRDALARRHERDDVERCTSGTCGPSAAPAAKHSLSRREAAVIFPGRQEDRLDTARGRLGPWSSISGTRSLISTSREPGRLSAVSQRA